jgi:hypothetical protein
MKPTYALSLLFLSALSVGCDRRDQPENAPTPQPSSETKSPATDPEQPTAPIEGQEKDQGTPADPKTGT